MLRMGDRVRLTKLKLRNFRCFGDSVTTIEFDDLTAFIGGNSRGKTAALQGLYKLFGSNDRERNLTRSDFHVPLGELPGSREKIELFIEAIVEFPELLDEDDSANHKTVPEFFRQMVVDEVDGPPFVRIRLSAVWQNDHSPEGAIDSAIEFICSPDDDVTDETPRHKCVNIKSRIQMIYVPAMRDPTSQLKYQANTLIGQLTRSIKWSAGLRASVDTQATTINKSLKAEEGVGKLSEIVNNQWSILHNEDKFKEASINFVSIELDSLLKGMEFRFRPTHTETDLAVNQLGDGHQSLFYLSLVASVLELQNKVEESPEIFSPDFNLPLLTIVGMEEPENHLAPHLLGKTVTYFSKLAQLPNAQVVFTSHNPTIFRRVIPENIRHFKARLNNDIVVSKIKLPKDDAEAFTYVKEAVMAYPELYFSQLVVLGEGDSEEIIIPRVLRSFACDLDSELISVVPLGGRHVNHFWKLLNDLEIQFITLIDIDIERNTGGWERVKYLCEQLIKNDVPREQIVTLMGGAILSDEILEELLKRSDSEMEQLNIWLDYLRKHDIIFSYPLDLDFLMLKAFPDRYKATVSDGRRGPQIPDEPAKLAKRRTDAIARVLKSEDATAETYSKADVDLFIWYSYLFLGRSKPVSHLQFLAGISDDELRDGLPHELRSLVSLALRKLGRAPLSQQDEAQSRVAAQSPTASLDYDDDEPANLDEEVPY